MPFLREPRRLWWLVFALLCLSVLVHLALYLIDHRSTALLLLAVVVAAAALGGMTISGVVAVRLTAKGLSRLRERARRWRSVYLVVGFGLTFAFGVGIRPEWVYAHIAATLSAGLVLGYELLFGDSAPPRRIWFAAGGVAAILITLFRLYALSVYPTYNVIDEPWVLGWAMSYLQKGYLADTILYYGGADVQRFMLPVAWWISLVGAGFWQVRLFFFLLIFPLIALTALAARSLYRGGWIAALFMFSSAVVMGAARIRHDIGLAIAVAACLWLYSEAAKRNKNSLHFLAGLAIGLGWFAHYHAIGFGAALFVGLYLPRWVAGWRRGQRMPETGAWLFVAGGLLAAASVFLLQILPDWAGFQAMRGYRGPPSAANLVNSFVAHWGNIAYYSQLEFVLVIAALVTALWRRRLVDTQLALLLLLLHSALAILAGEPYPHYVLQISSVYGILIAGMLTNGLRGQKLACAGVAAALFILPALGLTLRVPLQHLWARAPLQLPTLPAAAWVQENVAPTEKVVAEHWYYLFLTDYQFISPNSPGFVFFTPESHEAAWDEIAPDVVILDRNLPTCCVPPILTEDYLDSRGYEVVAEFPGERYPVLIYEKGAEND